LRRSANGSNERIADVGHIQFLLSYISIADIIAA
jgi:hypothetical protein